MIYCNNAIYAKVWSVTKSEKYIDLRVSTSEKDSRDGTYTDSTWFPRLIGHAFNSLKDTIKEGDRIIIEKAKLTNESYDAKDGSKKSRFRFLVFEARINEDSKPAEEQAAPAEAQDTTDKDESPW
jgi:single-stranded DNA-binding protein